jgi:methylmalonyl-CoA mutase C-terminal domain/subunit
MKNANLEHVGVMVGGIIPEDDIPKLTSMGVAKIFGPGTSLDDIVTFLKSPRESVSREPMS